MLKVLKKVIFLVFIFGIIVTVIPRDELTAQENDLSTNESINEAIENIKFYSSYNYQTLTYDRLQKLTTDFFLPVNYGEVQITYAIDSNYLLINETTEFISLRSEDGLVETEVYHVSVMSLPNVFKGEQTFLISANFNINDDYFTYHYQATVTPVIPDDFLGGAIYTMVRYGKMFLEGALITLGISLIGTIIGFILALFLATAKIQERSSLDSGFKKLMKVSLKRLSSIYITIFRGTPMIVQASFFWYGLGLFGNVLLCGLFVVSLNTAAYIAEILRGSIQAIDKGQTEASLSLGMSYTQTFLFIIFPQAIKNSMPAIGNEFVINIKDTAVLSVIGIFELFNMTKKITGMHYRQLEAYAIVALIYLVLTYSTTTLLKLVEKRMGMKPVELTSSN
jgi:putative lysine transport system permease protein